MTVIAKVTVELDLTALTDILVELRKPLSHDEGVLRATWAALPERLKKKAIYYGLDDTEVRDDIFRFLARGE